MIKCNHCGNMTSIGAVCQSCGAPLSNKADNGFAPQMGRQEQPEVPAWLESLRVVERPAATTSNPTNFSPADLIEEGALPSWMRNERERTNSQAAIPNPMAYSEQPENGSVFPSPGLDASSLIDEKALPSWMQEDKSPLGQPPSSPGSFSAGSLVQPENLPEWMKTLQQGPEPELEPAKKLQQPQAPAQTPFSSSSPVQPAAPGQGFSARDLLNPQSLPSWMQSMGTSGPLGAQNSPALPANPGGNTYGSGSPVMNANTNTGDVAQAPWNSKPDQGMPGVPNSPQGNGQTGFSASSLLDMDSLPQWLRENGKQGGAPSPMQPSGQPNWQNGPAQSPVPSSMQTPPTTPQDGNRVPASSFIDMNALPNWLRSTDQPAQGGSPAQPVMGSGFYNGNNEKNGNNDNGYNIPGVTPRADNMRVPSRPRNEVNASESSELAANVFASMLGVASSTPNFSGQQSPVRPPMNSPQQPGANPPYQQPGTNPLYQQPGANPLYQQPGANSPYQQPGANPPYQQPGANPLYQQPGQANAYGMMNPAGQGYNANPDPYSQLSQSKTNIPNPNLGGSSASNINIPNPNLGGSSASNINIPNPLAVPNTPGGMNDPFGQNSYPNAASGSYNGMYSSSIGLGQGNPPSLSNIASPYGASRAAGSGQPNAGQSMAGMQAPAGGTDEQKSNKKRGIFEAIRDWLSR